MIFVFLSLTLLTMMISRFIHIAANGIISFLFMTIYYSIVYIYIYIYICMYMSHLSLSIYLLMDT